MSNLSNQQINQSFQGLLQVPGGIDSSLKVVQDGNGNPTGLSLSSTGASVTTSSTFAASINGTQVPNTVPRLIADGFGDYISVKDFGAVGDGIVDDTTALQTAITYGATNKIGIYVPCGTYLCDTLNVPNNTINNGFTIVGSNVAGTILQKKSADSLPLLKINNSSIGYYNDIVIANITFFGIAGNTTEVVVGESLVRSLFSNIVIKNGIIGFNFKGGISNTLRDCIISNNQTGVKIDHDAAAYGGGWPNNNSITNCVIVDNSIYGIYFDYGRVLNITCCDIEGNGTTANLSSSGVWVGDHIGYENSPILVSPGVSIKDTWFEGNAGQSAIVCKSGINFIGQCYFVANANAVHDVYFAGGRYVLDNCDFDSIKTYNVYETSGVLATNYILNSDYNYHEFIDSTKTVVVRANSTISNKLYFGSDGNAAAFEVNSIANSVNHILVYGNSTGNAPVVRAKGTDTNVALIVSSQGTSAISFYTNSVSNKVFELLHTASAVNYVALAGSSTGNAVALSAQGTDANINFSLAPKGSGICFIPLANVPNYANDAAAAAGGVPVGGIYRNSNVLQIRIV